MRVRLLSATIAVTCALVAPVPAATASGALSTAPVALSFTLAPPNPAALEALASDTTTPTTVRRARLAALLPSDAAHQRLTDALSAAGLTITGQSAWTVTAVGRSNVVTQLLGVLPTALSLPVPQALSRIVSIIQPVAGTPLWKPALTARPLSGIDLRNAYANPGRPSGAGHSANGALTIATIQFSSWNQNDLASYAAKIGRPNPLKNHQFRSVLVDGGPTDSDGAIEVDLDQEALLATSPWSNQQMYAAPNSAAGFTDAYSAVLDDVMMTKHAKVPNPRIAAMSNSWGSCESATGASAMKAMQPILQSLVAAGVNIFSASGDGGIYDCSSSLLGLGGGGGLLGGGKSTDVDFPASSPWVIGVGGTRLMSVTSPSTTNNGHNWSETAWGCVSSSDCANNGGSGGGQSSTFKAPGYQTRFVTNAPFRGRTGRMVPDIAANADSATGFLTTTSSNGKEQVAQVGGTSLAAPVSAALFVDLLASLGRTRGVGDLHGGLYRAYSTHHAIRDIHSGSNGAAGDSPNDPSTSAAFGYDTVTGIGAVLWSGLSGFLPA